MPDDDPTARAPGNADSSIGWYGKLPVAGDFVGRRLPAGFVEAWDRWLQQGLAFGREHLGERWQDLYLTFPVWRFVVPSGIVDESAWCGTLMPSVDRVGRLFPLTICRPLRLLATEPARLISIDRELAKFAQAGLAALEGVSIEAFDQMLGSIPAPSELPGLPEAGRDVPALEVFCDPAGTGRWPLSSPLDRALAKAAERVVTSMLNGRSLWWTAPGEGSTGTMRLESPPLAPELLTRLIGED